MSTFRPTCLILTLLFSTCVSLNTYTIAQEQTAMVWRSTSPFYPQVATSYGDIRIGKEMSIEFDFVYEGRTSTYLNQFFRIGAASDTQNCDGGDSKYPSMWLKYGSMNSAILDIQFTGDTTECGKNYLADYGNLVKDVDHHIIISLNETKAAIKITGGDKAPFSFSWARNPTPLDDLGKNVSVWWSGDLFGAGDLEPAFGTFSNIVITTDLYTPPPTAAPTTPSTDPTRAPSAIPTTTPSQSPSGPPTLAPSPVPTRPPSSAPSASPIPTPTTPPTHLPTTAPTTAAPTLAPTDSPTTAAPTDNPTTVPTALPTSTPTASPTTAAPTANPTTVPTSVPSPSPTEIPTALTGNPTVSPTPVIPTTSAPSPSPSKYPTRSPTGNPTLSPSEVPTEGPTYGPTHGPSRSPTHGPTEIPTDGPTRPPSRAPTEKGQTRPPSVRPTVSPSRHPSTSPTTAAPTTAAPTTANPSEAPTKNPSAVPSVSPTRGPTAQPSQDPSQSPTKTPTRDPTQTPSESPTDSPSKSPTESTSNPSVTPTELPSANPSQSPSVLTTDDDNNSQGDDNNSQFNTGTEDPYTYIFYGAIAFVAFLLIGMAFCCYCKFKPPKEDQDFAFEVTGHSKDGKEHKMVVSIDNTRDGTGPTGGVYGNVGTNTSRTQTEHTSSMAAAEIVYNSSDEDVLKGAYGGHIKSDYVNRNGAHKQNDVNRVRANTQSQETMTYNTQTQTQTQTQTTPMQYGNNYRAGKQIPSVTLTSTQQIASGTGPGHGYNYVNDATPSGPAERTGNGAFRHDVQEHMHGHIVYSREERPVAMDGDVELHEAMHGMVNNPSSNIYEYYDEDDEDEDDDEYEEESSDDGDDGDDDGDDGVDGVGNSDSDSDEEPRGYNPNRRYDGTGHRYIQERHPVDQDEQYLVEMITNDELRKKVAVDLRQREMNALKDSDEEYAHNMVYAGQQNTDIMNDIIQEMNDKTNPQQNRNQYASNANRYAQ